ncbi:hypothetical protein [Lysinibacillus xylanilyticus]|uniref:hypothetical protein n=1 Tax=Lysinibacillus xylanilyticus TaxID=582475 RepID=UPI003CFC67DA
MKSLHFNDRIFRAEEIVRDNDSIVGYTNGAEVFSFNGISDFSVFVLEEGQTFDEPKQTEIEKLKLELAEGNAQIMELIFAMMGGK